MGVAFKFFADGYRLFTGLQVNSGLRWAGTQTILAAASDEATPLVAGVGKVSFRLPKMLLTEAPRLSLNVASDTGPVVVDITAAGISILAAPISIAQGSRTSFGGMAALRSRQLLLPDDVIMSVNINSAGNAATGLKVTLFGYRQ